MRVGETRNQLVATDDKPYFIAGLNGASIAAAETHLDCFLAAENEIGITPLKAKRTQLWHNCLPTRFLVKG